MAKLAAAKRPIRTATQGAPAWILTEAIDSMLWDMDDRQYGVMVLLLTMVISYAQTAIENWHGSGFLRDDLPENGG